MYQLIWYYLRWILLLGTLRAQKMWGYVLPDKRVEEGEFTECLLRCYLYKEAGMILSREAELVSHALLR